MAVINSNPQYFALGAVHHYVRIGGPGTGGPPNPGTIYYLGTCEVQPEIRIWELSAEVRNDMAGRLLPGQKTDQGEKADIGLQLSRYSEAAYTAIKNPRGVGNALQVQTGWQGRFGRGSLVFGSKTFEMWQVYEVQTSAIRNTFASIGFYWPQIELLQHAPVTLGNQEKQLLLVMEAQAQFQPQASYNAVSGNERSWLLYREDDTPFTTNDPTVGVPQ